MRRQWPLRTARRSGTLVLQTAERAARPIVRQAISDEIGAVLADLEVLLHTQDEAEIERRSQMSTKEAVEVKASASAPGAGSVSTRMSAEEGRTEEMLERLRRSKANYLHGKILEYQRLLKRVVDLANADGPVILDDLYYIRRSTGRSWSTTST
jgi:hypothetical protein